MSHGVSSLNSVSRTASPPRVHPEIVERVKEFFESRDLVRRGICLLNAGCHADAVEAFSAARRLNPDSINLTQYLVRAYLGCGDCTSASAHLTELIKRDPDDITSRIRHAMLLWKNGDRSGAITSLRQSIAASPDCAELHFQLGNLLAQMDDGAEEAEMRLTLAVELDPRHADAMVNLAMWHAAHGQPARALRLLQKAQSLRPQDARIALLLGMARGATGGHHDSMTTSCAMPVASVVDDRRAAESLSKIIEGDPGFLEAFTALSFDEDLYLVLCDAIQRAIERRPDMADLQYHLGWVLDRLDRVDEAIASTERALALDRRPARSLIQLAKLYRRTGRLTEAADRLKEALRCGGHYADVYLLLGSVYRDSGQTDRARAAYRKALKINGNYRQARLALESLSGSPC